MLWRLFSRAYYALIRNPRITSKGKNTNAQFGFTNTVIDLINNQKPTHMAVCFEGGEPVGRTTDFADYKANRQEAPEDISASIPDIRRILAGLNIPMMDSAGFEADDVIGTLCKQAEKLGYEVYMVTPDKDYGQLVSEHIRIYKPGYQGGDVEIMGPKEVCDKWCIQNVDQVRDILGLMGDAVDNIPGIAGVGQKTACKLLTEYGSLENILENADNIKGALGEKIRAGREDAIMSKKLATIITSVPVEFHEEDFRLKEWNKEGLKEIFNELEFKTIGRRLLGDEFGEAPGSRKSTAGVQTDLFGNNDAPIIEQISSGADMVQPGKNIHNTPHEYEVVESPAEIKGLLDELDKHTEISFDTETTGIDANNAELVGLSFCVTPHIGWYVPIPPNKDEALGVLAHFQSLFDDESSLWIGHTIKYDMLMLKWYGIELAGKIFDTLLAHYVIEPEGKRNMDWLSAKFLGYETIHIEELIGKKGKGQGNMRDVEIEKVKEYAVEDADVTLQFKSIFEPMLDKYEVRRVFDEVEAPLAPVLKDMEYEGVKVDMQFLADYSKLLEDQQKNAWLKQIDFLKNSLKDIEGSIYFEFTIPRMGKRVDNILIANNFIFVIEFKVGDSHYTKDAQYQTIDYCLDLQNFHEGSHEKTIIPILVATKADRITNDIQGAIRLDNCILCNADNLESTLKNIFASQTSTQHIKISDWESSAYKPTPTIIEAAQALYKGHNVQEISLSDSGAINLSRTAAAINKIIEYTKTNKQKSICFLTGVPGAGKTLAGLNIANERLKADESEHSVFLSGNGPLVDVLREALTRDSIETAKQSGEKLTRSSAEREAKAFIQNIHHFRDDNLKTEKAPIEKVVVFDEAQRAWQKEQVSKFMKAKKGIDDFEMSEPEYLISVMNRHEDWCTIVCLIGGGQEINTGEAGVSEWIESLKQKYPNWNIYYSDKILSEQSTYLNDEELLNWLRANGNQEADLHLAVSLRSFRSEKVALLIQNILENESEKAKDVFNSIKDHYPIFLTRNLRTAKNWLKQKAKGTERIGIIASSGGRRLRADGIDVKNQIEQTNWFLNGKDDVRSSYYLEETATEFDIQGLEIDFTCVAWDINLFYTNGWNFQNFKGSKWQNINLGATKNYLLNSYRVLLTRARQGMIILVPDVDNTDATRPKQFYDRTFEYLKQCGLTVL